MKKYKLRLIVAGIITVVCVVLYVLITTQIAKSTIESNVLSKAHELGLLDVTVDVGDKVFSEYDTRRVTIYCSNLDTFSYTQIVTIFEKLKYVRDTSIASIKSNEDSYTFSSYLGYLEKNSEKVYENKSTQSDSSTTWSPWKNVTAKCDICGKDAVYDDLDEAFCSEHLQGAIEY